VRQGEAGHNLLSGPADGYDLERLVQQLQRRGASTTLESRLDRLVDEQIQQQLEALFTSTGKVKAGSPLALAAERVKQASHQLEQALERQVQLEEAMETLRTLAARLEAIDGQERPALEALRQREATLQLRRAEVQPLRQHCNTLQQALQTLEGLERQCANQQAEQASQQQLLAASQQALDRLHQQIAERTQALETLHQQGHLHQQHQELAQQLLDRDNLEREAEQLRSHQQQFSQLQQQAEERKAALAALPPIDGAQVKALRQQEQRLAQAEARCQAMATSLTVLEAEQPVWLDDQALAAGQELQLTSPQTLQLGPGVRVRISPGGGAATAEAQAQLAKARQELEQLRAQLGVVSSELAEPIAQERHSHEAELQRLRQAAAAIPWAQLDAQRTALDGRRQRLEQALALHAPIHQELTSRGDLPSSRDGLESWISNLRTLRQTSASQQQQHEQELRQSRLELEQLQAKHRSLQTRLEQLTGSLQTLAERRQLLEHNHGQAQALKQELAQQQAALAVQEQALSALEQQANQPSPGPSTPDASVPLEQRSQALEAEKDTLLTAKGHNEQLCFSLSATDPAAEVEQCQASLETAQAEWNRLQQQAEAWQYLQQLFHQARSALADRYSAPLSQAIDRYLQCLGITGQQSQLSFDPKAGFGGLQLLQNGQGFAFEQLSGGMREQFAAALRLAMAEVLQPAYDNCLPLVFDDAFTNSDPDRLTGLGRMLEHGATAGIQIIVLSCNPTDYTELARRLGRVIALEPPILAGPAQG
jgi:DNA repair exonuclease SbcCD ATPase subunit